MKLLELLHIQKFYGTQEVLHSAGFSINSGNCYGLIGANGSGKTTLLNIITGAEEASSGKVTCSKGLKIGYVHQFLDFDTECTVRDFLSAEYEPVIQRVREAEEKLQTAGEAEMEKVLLEYQNARDVYDSLECDLLEKRIETTLSSLGLAGKTDQNLDDLSGGEKSILNLAAALLKKPDILILDEPGNHLDFKGLAWLEDFLSSYNGTVLLVSHNRYLLDRICTHILELEEGCITAYKGNYSSYRMEKLTGAVAKQADYKADQQRIARLEAVVKKFEEIAKRVVDPGWGKRLRAKRSQLSKLKENSAAKPELDKSKITLNLEDSAKKSKIALGIQDFTFGFENNLLYENAGLEIFRGEKAALIGPNGCGKSTLLKKVLSCRESDSTHIRVGPSLKIGYLSQKQDIFDPERSVEDEIRNLGPLSKNDAFKLISPFLFTYNDLDKKVKDLSGGEKNRLQLAVIKYQKPDFLILDEPTNHLDIPSREAMEESLADFKGTMLIVSHDRYFLDKLSERVIEIKDKKLHSHTGNFSEYWAENVGFQMKLKSTVSLDNAKRKQQSGENGKKEKNRNGSSDLNRLEERITELEAEKAALEKQTAAFFHKGDHKSGKKSGERLTKVIRLIEEAYRNWEALV